MKKIILTTILFLISYIGFSQIFKKKSCSTCDSCGSFTSLEEMKAYLLANPDSALADVDCDGDGLTNKQEIDNELFSFNTISEVFTSNNLNMLYDGLKIIIYPNPIKDEGNILISSDAINKVEVSVFNMSGKLVEVIKDINELKQGVNTINFSKYHLTPGIYQLRITIIDKQQIYNKRIIIQ